MSTKGSMTTRACPLVQDQNLNIRNKGSAKVHTVGSKAQQKSGVGVRKALANITNADKPSSNQASKKNKVMKNFANKGIPMAIEEERCLHNHQCCINLQRHTNTQALPKTILELEDEQAPLELWSPKTPRMMPSKVDFLTTPRHLEFTQSPLSLKVRNSVHQIWSPFSPLT